MAVLTSSLIARIDQVTNDPQRKRFTLRMIAEHLNEAQGLIAELRPRSAAHQRAFTLGQGSRQDLRSEPNTVWIRLHEVICNASATGQPTGRAIRQIDRSAVDRVAGAWRSYPASAEVLEYALDERDPFTFDIFPPSVGGNKVVILATVRPAPVCVLTPDGTALLNPNEVIGLQDGFDLPMVDWALYRLFLKDAADPAYQARAEQHRAAVQLTLGVTLKDAQS